VRYAYAITAAMLLGGTALSLTSSPTVARRLDGRQAAHAALRINAH